MTKNACGYKIVYETERKTANRGRYPDDFNDSSSTVSNAFFSEAKDSPPRKSRKRLRTTFQGKRDYLSYVYLFLKKFKF